MHENIFICAVAKIFQSFNNQIFYMVYWCDSFKTFHRVIGSCLIFTT